MSETSANATRWTITRMRKLLLMHRLRRSSLLQQAMVAPAHVHESKHPPSRHVAAPHQTDERHEKDTRVQPTATATGHRRPCRKCRHTRHNRSQTRTAAGSPCTAKFQRTTSDRFSANAASPGRQRSGMIDVRQHDDVRRAAQTATRHCHAVH